MNEELLLDLYNKFIETTFEAWDNRDVDKFYETFGIVDKIILEATK